MRVYDDSGEIKQLNEVFVNVAKGLDPSIENSIYHAKLKRQLHPEIVNFCKEKLELKNDLNFLRMMIGDVITENQIREYLDALKLKYNNGATDNIGIDYHIEITRYDFGVPVFVVIKRNDISMKKFVFRFKRENRGLGLDGISSSGVPINKEGGLS